MESMEIISSIKEIYEQFQVMPSLQMHMRKVAAVADWILSTINCIPKADKNDVIAALLLHDLGNIVKFKLGEELTDWRKIQQETIAEYGSDDHVATEKMVRELGVRNRLAFLISEMGFENLQHVIDSNDMELKICLYADLRVAPDGIVSLQKRFADLRERYKNTAYESRYGSLQVERALLLEHQVFKNSTRCSQEINDQTITSYGSH
jgi:hypothetical protein